MSAIGETVSTFLHHSKPKGTASMSYDIWRDILCRAWTRQQVPKNNLVRWTEKCALQHQTVMALFLFQMLHSKIFKKWRVADNNSSLGKLMWCDWPEKGTDSAFDNKNNISIDKLKRINSSVVKRVIAYGDQSNHVCSIFANVSRKYGSCRLSGKRPVKHLCSFGLEISMCMQNRNCGKQHGSDNNGYFIVGERANRNTSHIGENTDVGCSFRLRFLQYESWISLSWRHRLIQATLPGSVDLKNVVILVVPWEDSFFQPSLRYA